MTKLSQKCVACEMFGWKNKKIEEWFCNFYLWTTDEYLGLSLLNHHYCKSSQKAYSVFQDKIFCVLVTSTHHMYTPDFPHSHPAHAANPELKAQAKGCWSSTGTQPKPNLNLKPDWSGLHRGVYLWQKKIVGGFFYTDCLRFMSTVRSAVNDTSWDS